MKEKLTPFIQTYIKENNAMDNLQADELSVEEGISLQLLIFEQFSSLSRELNKKDKHES